MTLPAPLEVSLLSIQIVVASGAPGDQIVKPFISGYDDVE